MITGDRFEAEEIAQEAFLRVFERWDRVSRMDEPAGYLFQVAMNVFRTRRRRASLGLRRAMRMAPASTDEFTEVEDRATVLRGLAAGDAGSAGCVGGHGPVRAELRGGGHRAQREALDRTCPGDESACGHARRDRGGPMIDDRELLERELRRFVPEPGFLERVMRRRDRRDRNRRITAGVVGAVIVDRRSRSRAPASCWGRRCRRTSRARRRQRPRSMRPLPTRDRWRRGSPGAVDWMLQASSSETDWSSASSTKTRLTR